MKKTSRSLFVAALAAVFLSSAPLFAHDEHCHVKGADGKITDVKDATDKKSCEAKGGTWKHHHAHCHKKGDAHADIKASSEKDCSTAGGVWSDHGHDKLSE